VVPINVRGDDVYSQENLFFCDFTMVKLSCRHAPITSSFLSNIHAGADALCRDMTDNMAMYILADAACMMLLGYILDDGEEALDMSF
jgi:hypothetical protein